MSVLLNKTFFKFLFGFVAIVASSFLVISAVGYYNSERTVANVVSEPCEAGEENC
jgi:hypothetical protein